MGIFSTLKSIFTDDKTLVTQFQETLEVEEPAAPVKGPAKPKAKKATAKKPAAKKTAAKGGKPAGKRKNAQ